MLGDSVAVPGAEKATDEFVPAAITDIGCERELNEDRYAVVDAPVGRVWVVCDGMGGTQGGELAAQLAIDAIRRSLESGVNSDSVSDALRSAIEEANRVIVLRRQNPMFSAMGTTVVGVLISGDEVVVCHAGDSRAYLVRDGALQQLTTDHSYVQDLIDRGSITPEEALSHPQSHVLTRCLGAEPRLEVDTQEFWIWTSEEAEPQDKIVICSDGLYSLVADDEIAQAVSQLPPQESCVQLVELAKSRGGYDNITLAVLPLGGQLREESGEPRPKKQTTSGRKAQVRRPKVANVEVSTMPFGRKVALAFIVMLLGALIAILVVLLHLLSS